MLLLLKITNLSTTSGNLLVVEFEIAPGNAGNLLEVEFEIAAGNPLEFS